MKNKLILLLTLIATTSFFLPSFFFNQLEYKFRSEFHETVNKLDQADKGIQDRIKRSQDLANGIDVQEIAQDSLDNAEAIESTIDLAYQHIQKARSYTVQQERYLFMLSDKYKEYYHLKLDAVNDYAEQITEYKNRKELEHLLTNTTMLLSAASVSIGDMSDYDAWWQNMGLLPQAIEDIRNNAQKLLDSKEIDEDVYHYIVERLKPMEFMVAELDKVDLEGSWDNFNIEGLKAISELKTISNEEFFNKVQETRDQRFIEYLEKVEKNDEQLLQASDYYNENKLAEDVISQFVSIFNSRYPLMKVKGGREFIIPHGFDEQTVSFVRNENHHQSKH